MARFHFKARNPRGEAVEGELNAMTAEAVADQLLASELTPVDIRPVQPEAGPRGLELGIRLGLVRVGLADLIMLSRQMYTLLHAGVPIVRAIRGLAEGTPVALLSHTLNRVADDLEAGHPLEDCLAVHPRVFSPLYVSIIRVGEASGRLDASFLQMAHYLDRDKETRDRIRAALRYPLLVIAAIVLALGVINLLVIPAFSKVFARFGHDLPLPTQVLLTVSNFTVTYWPFLLLVLVTVVVTLPLAVNTPRGRYRWDRFKLRLPLVGRIVEQALLERFARSFAIALEAGVPLLQALTVVSRAVDNAFIGARILDMQAGIQRGEGLSRTARACGLFNPLVLQMLAVGEETGALGELMDQVAQFYEREVDYDLRRLSAAIEPVLIAIIGAMVLVLALGVFLPIWDLYGLELRRGG